MKYFDTRHYEPLKTPEEVGLVADVLANAPRGGTKRNCCVFCTRGKVNHRLRSCDTCHQHYCGRRACRLAHAFKCGHYRPHWQGFTNRPIHGEPLCSSHAQTQKSHSTKPTAQPKSSPTALKTPSKALNAPSTLALAAQGSVWQQDAPAATAPEPSTFGAYAKHN